MIREEGGEASVFVGDVTSNDDMREMAEAAKFRYGNVNVLVNNVGINGPGSVTDIDVDFWDTVLDVNLKSVMLCSRYTIPQMIEAGGGSVVNISSIIGLRAGGGPPTHPYAAAKGGMIGLNNSMAVHYGRDNVRVNCIAPGQIHSHLWLPARSPRNGRTCAAALDRSESRELRGTWPTPPCSLAYRRVPLGLRSHACRWTPEFWSPRRWPCSPIPARQGVAAEANSHSLRNECRKVLPGIDFGLRSSAGIHQCPAA